MTFRIASAIALAATLTCLGSCAKAPSVATAPTKASAQRHVLYDIPAWDSKYSERGCYTFQPGVMVFGV
jgi:hypothetical protein